MNKNNIIIGIFTGIAVAGVAYCIKKMKDCQNNIDETNREIGRQFQNIYDKVKENAKETSTKDDDFLQKMMDEEKEAEEATKNWSEREERCRKEMAEKKSMKDMDVFEDNVSESSEFEALNKIREASGKEPLKVNEQFEKFLGKDSESKSMKESLDNIAEGIKKDPKLKKKILDALSE
jgi:hypothetical protein